MPFSLYYRTVSFVGHLLLSNGLKSSFWLHSLLTEADAGHTEFTDEVYQNETRYPGGEWKAGEDQYTDVVRAASDDLAVLSAVDFFSRYR